MKKTVSVLLSLVFCGSLTAQYRPPSPEELANGLKTAKPIRVLDSGHVVDQLSVSGDGRWLVYAYHEEDIKSNLIRMASTDGKTRKEIDAPRGFKNTPVIWANRLMFFTLDSAPGAALVDGIYFGPWDGPTDRWKLFEAGSFRDLAISDDGRFMAASTGNFDRANVRSTVKVWALGASGAKAGEGYTVGAGVVGQVRQVAWGPEARSLVVEINVDKAGMDWGQSNLYSTENKAGSAARLLRENGKRPVLWNQSGTAVLYFLEGDWQKSRILAYRPGDRVETVVATLENQEHQGLTANGLAWDVAGRRIILGVQNSPDIAGVVGFSPP